MSLLPRILPVVLLVIASLGLSTRQASAQYVVYRSPFVAPVVPMAVPVATYPVYRVARPAYAPVVAAAIPVSTYAVPTVARYYRPRFRAFFAPRVVAYRPPVVAYRPAVVAYRPAVVAAPVVIRPRIYVPAW